METTCILVIVCTTGPPRKKRPRTAKTSKAARVPPAKKLPKQLPLPFGELSSPDKSPTGKPPP